jgi:hypothetical protein
VGTWGTALFSDDVACDIRDHYRALIEDGTDDAAATRATLDKFREYLDAPDGIALIALAVTQSSIGRLDPGIRDRALGALDRGADLEEWQRENPKLLPKRRAVFDKLRAQLSGPQPARKRLRPPKRVLSGLAAGDVIGFTLPRRLALLRVVRVRTHRLGDVPVLEELDFHGTEVPSLPELERLRPKVEDPIAFVHALSPDTRLFAHMADRVDWQRAGFHKVETIGARAGDDQAALPSFGISWAELAERYRQRAGS